MNAHSILLRDTIVVYSGPSLEHPPTTCHAALTSAISPDVLPLSRGTISTLDSLRLDFRRIPGVVVKFLRDVPCSDDRLTAYTGYGRATRNRIVILLVMRKHHSLICHTQLPPPSRFWNLHSPGPAKLTLIEVCVSEEA